VTRAIGLPSTASATSVLPPFGVQSTRNASGFPTSVPASFAYPEPLHCASAARPLSKSNSVTSTPGRARC
jgi:hypothetical protein